MCWVCEPPQSFGQRKALVSHTEEHYRPVPASQQANDCVGPSNRPEAMGLHVDSCNDEVPASDSLAEETDWYSCNEEVPASDSLAEEDDWYSCYEVPVAEEAEPREQDPCPTPEEPDITRRYKIKRFEFFLAIICYELMLQV